MIVQVLKRLAGDRTGATAIEYGLIVALVVIVMIAGLSQVGNGTTGLWGNINDRYTKAQRGS